MAFLRYFETGQAETARLAAAPPEGSKSHKLSPYKTI